MCSELFRIPYSWAGVPIFGFGVLLAVWAIAGLSSLGLSIRRHGWNAETWGLVPLLALTGAAILWLPKLFPDGLPIRGYGLMVLLGVVSGIALATYRARQVGLNHEIIWSLAFWLFIGGILGARLFYVIEYWDQRFRSDSLATTIFRVLDFPEGGLVIYGALLGGAVATIAFVRKHHLPLLALADLITPSMLVGLALGRIGCLLNGCCYGGPSTLPWAVTFPPTSPPYLDQVANGEMYGFRLDVDHPQRPTIEYVEPASAASTAGLAAGDVITRINSDSVFSLVEAQQVLMQEFSTHEPLKLQFAKDDKRVELAAADPPARSRPVHPAQVYSAIDAALLAWFLWAYYPFRRRDGEVIALLLTIHPISRFMLEIIRTDEPAVWGTGLSISQNISILIFVVAVGVWVYLLKQPRRVAWPAQVAS
ncbi:MAG TPA: prolipoprotein diacylglyceryl transferase family protein [Lacipirellulaceae bacterium]|jgi:phosphatidylglycerol:prolipoprotein diacylglycerol transferase